MHLANEEQDSLHARLSPCVMPYISAIPGVVIFLIGIVHVFSHGAYSRKWRPKWTKPFVPEYPPEDAVSPSPRPSKQRLGWVLSLLVVSVVGLVAQVVQLVVLEVDSTAVLLTISWVRYFIHYSSRMGSS